VKILITGSSGYLGYVLSRHFTAGGVPVVGVDLRKNPAWDGNDRYAFRRCSVTDAARLEEIFREELPDRVIHLAYLMNPIHDALRNREIDVQGSKNVVSLCSMVPSVEQVVVMSSASAYGAGAGNRLWLTEDAALEPGDYRYGVHKKEVEEWIGRFPRREGLRIAVLRMCTAIGPHYYKKGGVVSLLEKAPFLMEFSRGCALQFIHEDDLTAVMDLVVNDDSMDGTYNLAPDSFATVEELVPGKRFIPVPLKSARGITAVLWALRIAGAMPAAVTLSARGIIVDPAKIMKRYGYFFRYTTLEGYRSTVARRRELGTL
jgi:UDP-glucose 4-epimerase